MNSAYLKFLGTKLQLQGLNLPKKGNSSQKQKQ